MKIDFKKLSRNIDLNPKKHHNTVNSSGNDAIINSETGIKKLIEDNAGMLNHQAGSTDIKITGIGNRLKKAAVEKLTSKKTFSRDKSHRSHYITKK